VTQYLEDPEGAGDYESILQDVEQPLFFRVIGYKESDLWAGRYSHFERLSDNKWKDLGSVLGYSSDYIFPIVNKSGTTGAPSSDGGFGLMQLTIPAPNYHQIWNWKENIDGAVELIRGKLAQAKDWHNKVKVGCKKCKPRIPKAQPNAQPLSQGRELKMDVYSLYQSGRHYWKWNSIRQRWYPWKEEFKKGEKLPSGTVYADHGESIEKKPPTDF